LWTINRATGEAIYPYGGGTVTLNEWVPPETHALRLETVNDFLRETYRGIDVVARTDQGIVLFEIKLGNVSETGSDPDEVDPIAALPESALVAWEVRDLTGLAADKLAELFPVERESYQRWLSGRTRPSSANLERLLAFRHFLRELANRVEDPKIWLLAPLSEGTSSITPYEALKAGNLSAAWDAIADLPSKATRYAREAPDGETLIVTEGSLRGRDLRTSEEELDDYEDWLGKDE